MMGCMLTVERTMAGIVVSWDGMPGVDSVILDGETQDFTFVPVREYGDGSVRERIGWQEAKDFLGYRLRYFQDGIEISQSEPVDNPLGTVRYRHILMSACRSYAGVAIGFRDSVLYSRIELFDVTDGGHAFIIETMDMQVASDKIREGRIYQAEGYIRNSDGQDELVGVSEPWMCTCLNRLSENNPVFSVVVPCWNNVWLVHRALDSLLLQSFESLEIICVDDGSTDGTSGVLDWYASQYPCVKVIHNETNRKVSACRNTGVGLSSGRYIGFLDSDDTVCLDMYRVLWDAVQKYNLDVAECVLLDHGWDTDMAVFNSHIGKMSVTVYDYTGAVDHLNQVSSCGKVIRSDVAKALYFPDTEHGWDLNNAYEDRAYVPAMLSYGVRFAKVDTVYYVWEQRQRMLVETLSTAAYKDLTPSENLLKYVDSIIFPVVICCDAQRQRVEYKSMSMVMKACAKLTLIKGHSSFEDEMAGKIAGVCNQYHILANELVQGDKSLAAWLESVCSQFAS